MSAALTFRCTECGECCRRLRVALTVLDLSRLARHTLTPAHELVQWLSPSEVDMTGEPQSFVELSIGKRLMGLAQREGACVHLARDNRCQVYAARPLDCRAYPFDFTLEADGKRRLSLLALEGCAFASDGTQDLAAIERTEAARTRELEQHRALVARWNRLAWHRRRLGQRVGSDADFLRFALTLADAERGSETEGETGALECCEESRHSGRVP